MSYSGTSTKEGKLYFIKMVNLYRVIEYLWEINTRYSLNPKAPKSTTIQTSVSWQSFFSVIEGIHVRPFLPPSLSPSSLLPSPCSSSGQFTFFFVFAYEGLQYLRQNIPQGFGDSPTIFLSSFKKKILEKFFLPGESISVQYICG